SFCLRTFHLTFTRKRIALPFYHSDEHERGVSMRNALHTSVSALGLSGAYPNVYFADLAPPSSDPKSCTAPTSSWHNTLIPTGNVFEAAMQSAVFLNCEALTITQRNVNRTFSLLKRVIGIRNFGTIVDLEAAYWPDRLMALGGQLE